MTGETGSCFGRKVFLLRVVPEPESGRYAGANVETTRSLLVLGDFREIYEGLRRSWMSSRELKLSVTSAQLVFELVVGCC